MKNGIEESARVYSKGRKKNSGSQRQEEICGRERDGLGWGTRGKQDGHYRGFEVLKRWGVSRRKAGNLKVGLGWINGGRKDRGFGWGKIRGGGEQLF